MPQYVNKRGILSYFWFAVQMVDNRVKLSSYNSFKQLLPSIFQLLIVVHVIR